MKKLFVSLLIVLFIVPNIAFGFVGEKYSIDVPESYNNTSVANSFTDENGNNINVQVTADAYGDMEYSEDYLEEITKEITDNIDKYRESIREQVLEQYKDQGIDESVLNEMVNSIKYNDFIKKEITTFGKDDYKCLHYISDVSMMNGNLYTETYQTYYDDTIYTLTIGSTDLSLFDSEEIKNAVSSFKINDYVKKEKIDINDVQILEKSDKFYEKTENIVLAVVVFGIICGIIGLVKKSKKDKEDKND